jgi:hypothetical protein
MISDSSRECSACYARVGWGSNHFRGRVEPPARASTAPPKRSAFWRAPAALSDSKFSNTTHPLRRHVRTRAPICSVIKRRLGAASQRMQGRTHFQWLRATFGRRVGAFPWRWSESQCTGLLAALGAPVWIGAGSSLDLAPSGCLSRLRPPLARSPLARSCTFTSTCIFSILFLVMSSQEARIEARHHHPTYRVRWRV